jgi:hypothetical protein
MKTAADIRRALTGKYGHKINPDIVEELARDLAQALKDGSQPAPMQPPFEVGWMDSWVAHWTYHNGIKTAEQRTPELATVLRAMADLKFNERLGEITRFVRDRTRLATPPDAGPPEPGTPPAGPGSIFGGGIFAAPEPPDGGPPEPGVPDPPTPGPSPGPDSRALNENPWVLYWFVSLRAPELLSVIDAHFTRRLRDLAISHPRGA